MTENNIRAPWDSIWFEPVPFGHRDVAPIEPDLLKAWPIRSKKNVEFFKKIDYFTSFMAKLHLRKVKKVNTSLIDEIWLTFKLLK